MKLFLPLILLSTSLSAQSLHFGVAGGASLTNGFQVPKDRKDFILGPTAELRLPLGFSLEADALYRRMESNTGLNAFEFPILAKVRLGVLPLIKPFVAGGLSLRAIDSPVSKKGFTLGGGLEFQILKVRISPTLRYTRWGADSKPLPTILSGQNQAQFLVGISF